MPDETNRPQDAALPDDITADEFAEMIHRLNEAGITPVIVSDEEAGMYFTPDEVADLREMLDEWRKRRQQGE